MVLVWMFCLTGLVVWEGDRDKAKQLLRLFAVLHSLGLMLIRCQTKLSRLVTEFSQWQTRRGKWKP